MAPLVNEFSISHSSAQQWRTCRRSWAIARIQAWGGWERSAERVKAVAYRLTKMLDLHRLRGKLVHEMARVASLNPTISLDAATAELSRRFLRAVSDSATESWRPKGPKLAPPLAEHYYGEAHDGGKQALEAAQAALGELFVSPTFAEIRTLGGVDPALSEGLQSLQVRATEDDPDPVKIWVVLDLAQWVGKPVQEDRLRIVDWKTGRRRDDDRQQVQLYGAWAHGVAKLEPEEVSVSLVYLGEFPGTVDVPITVEGMQQTLDDLGSVAAEIRATLPNPMRIGGVPIESYPRTTDKAACSRCDLFEACYGHRDRSRPEPEGGVA